MSLLYGRLRSDVRGDTEVTRASNRDISAKLETWHGSVVLELHKDGTFTVYTGSKESPTEVAYSGRIEA